MKVPLIVDEEDPKWKLVKDVCTHIDSRRFHQEMSKIKFRPLPKGESVIKVVIVAMFFSVDIAYVVDELKKRKELRDFIELKYTPTPQYVSRFLYKFTPEQFLKLVFGYLGSLCKKRSSQRILIIDSTDIQIDLNWFKRKIKKKDLENKPYKWGYSSSKGYYIGYKLTFVVEFPCLRPVFLWLHDGCPYDAKLLPEILETLRRKRILRIRDIFIGDKGYCKYSNYKLAFSKYRVIPLIFPRKDFSIEKILSQSFSIEIYEESKPTEKEKQFFIALYEEFKEKLLEWKDFKPIRRIIEDVFKLLKEGFFKEKIHRYTKKSCERFIASGVLLAGIIFSEGFRSKEHLQTMAEW